MKQLSFTSFFILLFIIILNNNTSAQEFPSEFWHPGKAVTYKKDTLYGEIMYNFIDNSIQVKQKTKLLVLTSKTLLYFTVQDQFYSKKREFFIIPVNTNDYSTPLLFEVLYKGPLTLLNREYIINTYVSTGPYSPQIQKRILSQYLFILDSEGEIFEINKKKTLIYFFKGVEEEIATYIKSNKLKIDNKEDMKKLLHHYNITFFKKTK